MSLESVLSERCQAQGAVYCMIPLTGSVQDVDDWGPGVSAQDAGSGAHEILKLDILVLMVAQPCEYAKNHSHCVL